MIPKDFITEWRKVAPWPSDIQVEHDLVISRALLAIFENKALSKALAFRGGTALSKLYFSNASRFSEDIDLVQLEPNIKIFEELRKSLDPWLGTPRRSWGDASTTIVYRYSAEDRPQTHLRLKIEINTRESYSVFGYIQKDFEVRSRWNSGTVKIQTYTLDELLGTKLRALYQRRKGRDLFDLWLGITKGGADPAKIFEAFHFYLDKQGLTVSKKQFVKNLDEKLNSSVFLKDAQSLLPLNANYDPSIAAELVKTELLGKMR